MFWLWNWTHFYYFFLKLSFQNLQVFSQHFGNRSFELSLNFRHLSNVVNAEHLWQEYKWFKFIFTTHFSSNSQCNLNRKVFVASNSPTVSIVYNLGSWEQTQPFEMTDIDARSTWAIFYFCIVNIASWIHFGENGTNKNYQKNFHHFLSIIFNLLHSSMVEHKLTLFSKTNLQDVLGTTKTGIINFGGLEKKKLSNWFFIYVNW